MLQAQGQPLPLEIQKANQIHAYANMIKVNGFFLEVVDADVFVKQIGGRIAVAMENPLGAIEVLPCEMQWSPVLGPDLDIPEIDPRDPNTWVLVSCNALYDPAGPKNHWIPGFFKDQISPDAFYDLTALAAQPITQKYRAKRDELLKVQDSLNGLRSLGTEVDPEAEILLTSKIAALEVDVQQLLYRIHCLQMITMFTYVKFFLPHGHVMS